jgi:hypothetical protein
MALKERGYLLQSAIPFQVTMSIVVGFEVIDIYHQEGEGTAISFAAGYFLKQ